MLTSGYGKNENRFNVVIQGQVYTQLPVSRYRVWCLERLRVAFSRLNTENRAITVESCWPQSSNTSHPSIAELANAENRSRLF